MKDDRPEYTLSAFVKRPGEGWSRVSRTIDEFTAKRIISMKPDPVRGYIDRDATAARLLVGERGPVTLVDMLQLEERKAAPSETGAASGAKNA
jgi:hypothetical protein